MPHRGYHGEEPARSPTRRRSSTGAPGGGAEPQLRSGLGLRGEIDDLRGSSPSARRLSCRRRHPGAAALDLWRSSSPLVQNRRPRRPRGERRPHLPEHRLRRRRPASEGAPTQEGVALTERLCVYPSTSNRDGSIATVMDVIKRAVLVVRSGAAGRAGAASSSSSCGDVAPPRDRCARGRASAHPGRADGAVRRDAGPQVIEEICGGRRRAQRRAASTVTFVVGPQHQRVEHLHRFRCAFAGSGSGRRRRRAYEHYPRRVRGRRSARRSEFGATEVRTPSESTRLGASRTTRTGRGSTKEVSA